MPHDPDDPTAHWSRRSLVLRNVLPLPEARPEDAEPVQVTVVGADVRARHRVLEMLARTPGLQVVGWADSAQALALLDVSSQICLVLEPGQTGSPAGDRGAPGPGAPGEPVRPQFSPRQREVLAAYAEGNELLDVVARRLGMGTETLKTHLRRIRVKYEAAGRPAPTRRDLYVRAVEDGLLPPPRRGGSAEAVG